MQPSTELTPEEISALRIKNCPLSAYQQQLREEKEQEKEKKDAISTSSTI
jgi:hypothetical protein